MDENTGFPRGSTTYVYNYFVNQRQLKVGVSSIELRLELNRDQHTTKANQDIVFFLIFLNKNYKFKGTDWVIQAQTVWVNVILLSRIFGLSI